MTCVRVSSNSVSLGFSQQGRASGGTEATGTQERVARNKEPGPQRAQQGDVSESKPANTLI